ncbi:hypothetical protein N665_2531s0002 [Sinapis alba]|nr:hypothetical protein N665_2531s0002 [Sinapis alba]
MVLQRRDSSSDLASGVPFVLDLEQRTSTYNISSMAGLIQLGVLEQNFFLPLKIYIYLMS